MSGRDTRNNPDQEPVEPRLTEAQRRLKRLIQLDTRVSSPAHVVAYTPAPVGNETVDVLLGFIPVKYEDTPVGTQEVPEAPYPIKSIPILFPGSIGSRITFPIPPGSSGLVIHTDRAERPWRESPVPGPVDPINGRAHHMGDAVFIPGLVQDVAPRSGPVNPAALTIEGPLVHLGAAAVDFAAKGTTMATAFTAWGVAMAAAGATAAMPPNPDPTGAKYEAYAAAVTTATATLAATIATWLSTKVQLQ